MEFAGGGIPKGGWVNHAIIPALHNEGSPVAHRGQVVLKKKNGGHGPQKTGVDGNGGVETPCCELSDRAQ